MPLKLTIASAGPVPVSSQIEEQIRVAITFGDLHPGEILPSIRDLAKQIRVGPGHVRKAYLELRETGLLASHYRKSFSVNHNLPLRRSEQFALRDRCRRLAIRLKELCEEHDIHPLSFGKYFFYQALEKESADPTVSFLHLTQHGAEEFAKQVSVAWGVPVSFLSFEEVKQGKEEEGKRKVFLVNLYREAEARKLMQRTGKGSRIVPVKLVTGPKILDRLNALKPESRVLCVFHDSDYQSVSQAVVSRLKQIVDEQRVEFESLSITQFHKSPFARLTRKFDLVAFSPHVWADLPDKIKRHSKVVENDAQIDLSFLEEARPLCGILL